MKIIRLFLASLLMFTISACDDGSGGGNNQNTFPLIPGKLNIDKKDINFGLTVNKNEQTIKISNAGTLPLLIETAYAVTGGSGYGYTLTPNVDTLRNRVLGGNEVIEMQVSFMPTSTSESTLLIKINDTDINIKGFGLGQWMSTVSTSTPPARERHSMAYDNKTAAYYIFGGENGATILSDLWKLSSSNQWSMIDKVGPMARVNASLMSINDNIYLFGGDNGKALPLHLNDLWLYRVTEDAWTEIKGIGGAAPKVTSNSKAVNIGSDIYFFQPATESSNVVVYKVNAFDSNRAWQSISVANAPKLIGKLNANVVIGDKVYLVGTDGAKNRNSMWEYDSKSRTFKDVTEKFGEESFPQASREEFRVASLPNGFAFFTINSSRTNEMWIYNIENGFTKTTLQGWNKRLTNFSVVSGKQNPLKMQMFGGKIIDGAVDNANMSYE